MDVVVQPKRFAVMTVDPGGVSGFAVGLFKNMGWTETTLARAVQKGVVRAGVVEGPSWLQARLLVEEWKRLQSYWNVDLGQPLESCVLVFENFQLRQLAVQLSPVEVTAGVEALLGRSVLRQMPSEAMGFATNDRLRDWGLYGLGRGKGDHRRDALRHLALRVNRTIGVW